MKENNKLEKTTVFLMTFVLVIGFVGLGAQVYGDTTQTSDVTVTVTEDTIEIDYVTYTDSTGTEQDIITDNAEGTDFGFSESDPAATDTDQIDFSVQITVYSDGDLDNIASASINIYAVNENLGDALGEQGSEGFFYELWENDDGGGASIWDGESETLTATFTTTDTDTFLRYGNWDIYAEILDSDDVELASETFTTALVAEEHTVFTGPADVSATIDPGQTVGTLSTGTPDVEFSQVTVDVETNYAWSLAMTDTELESTDSPDSIPAETADYEQMDGSPTTSLNLDVNYLYTATNVRPGTYSTTVTHTLSNDDSA